jgi:hypothetical protein
LPARGAVDRERYCVIELLRAPNALQMIDESLSRADLSAFSAEDFESVTHREVFTAIQTALGLSDNPTFDDVLEHIDPSLRADVSEWIETAAPKPPVGRDIDAARGVVDAALLLRERNLKTQGMQIEDLIRSASEENDADSIRELSQAKLALVDQLKRLSRMRYAPEAIRTLHAGSH